MPKKPRIKTLMDSQNVKASERQLKSARQYFCYVFFDNSETKLARKILF